MKKKVLIPLLIILLIVIIVVLSCNMRKTKVVEEGCTLGQYEGVLQQDLLLDVRGGLTCTYYITPEKAYTFKLIFNEENHLVNTEVYKRGKKIQGLRTHLLGQTDMYPEPPLDHEKDTYLEVEDINMDGYKDVKIRTVYTTKGPAGWLFFLYNPNTQKFDRSDEFSDLNANSYQLNPTTKTISTYAYGGLAGAAWTRNEYLVEKNKLILMKSIVQEGDFLDNGEILLIRNTYERINGELIKTSSEEIPEEEAMY